MGGVGSGTKSPPEKWARPRVGVYISFVGNHETDPQISQMTQILFERRRAGHKNGIRVICEIRGRVLFHLQNGCALLCLNPRN